MPGIGIILNPHSRSNKKNPERIKRLGFIVGDKGSCKETHDILDLPKIAQEFKSKDIEILGISGGDGTNHCTLSTFIDVYGDKPLPRIAFLRGGTMNNIANALNINGTPEKILSNLILKYHEEEEFEEVGVELLNVNGKHGFLFGNGLVVRFINEYYKRGKPTPLWALMLMTKFCFSAIFQTQFICKMAERYEAKVTVDGRVWPFKNYSLINAGTIETYGLGFRPFYRARSEEGKSQIIGISCEPRKVIYGIPWVFMAKKVPSDNYIDEMGHEILIELAKPQEYMIDGDVQPATDRILIKTGPRLRAVVR